MFLDRSEFPPFTALLEANWRIILEELQRIPASRFAPWHERRLYNRDWNVFGLYADGRLLTENGALCPETVKLLAQVPGLTTAGFSLLRPGTRILPHKGYSNAVLRCHLGLVIPQDCALTVGGVQKKWEEGKCLVFDDTSVHEAWNLGPDERVVLIADFLKEGRRFGPLERLKNKVLFFLAQR